MSSEKEILYLEDKRYAAMCGGDFAALEGMLHDELLYTHSSGFTDTKANVACFPPVGKDEVQERGLQRSKGAPRGRHRARHRSRDDRGGGQRPAAQLEACVPQRLDKNAEGLEVHRVAFDAAAHHIACRITPRARRRGDRITEFFSAVQNVCFGT